MADGRNVSACHLSHVMRLLAQQVLVFLELSEPLELTKCGFSLALFECFLSFAHGAVCAHLFWCHTLLCPTVSPSSCFLDPSPLRIRLGERVTARWHGKEFLGGSMSVCNGLVVLDGMI